MLGRALCFVVPTGRLGELLPSAPPIRHALKLELQHQWYLLLNSFTLFSGNELRPWHRRERNVRKLRSALRYDRYYGAKPLQAASTSNGGRRQYVWPATGSDSGTEQAPGGMYTGTDPNVAPGALLAIPAALAPSVNTTTVIGAKIKQASPAQMRCPCDATTPLRRSSLPTCC